MPMSPDVVPLVSAAPAPAALLDEDDFAPVVFRPLADLTFFFAATLRAGSPRVSAGDDERADSSRPPIPCCRRSTIAWFSPSLLPPPPPPSRTAASVLLDALSPAAPACSPCESGPSFFSSPSSTEHCCCSALSAAYANKGELQRMAGRVEGEGLGEEPTQGLPTSPPPYGCQRRLT